MGRAGPQPARTTFPDDARHGDLRGRRLEPWMRRAGVAVLVAVLDTSGRVSVVERQPAQAPG